MDYHNQFVFGGNSMSKLSSLERKRLDLIERNIIKNSPYKNIAFQEDQPHGFALNLCGHCNAKCSYCPQSLLEQPEEYINPKIVDNLLKSTINIPSYFQFGTRGENLLNPLFSEYVRQIKRNNPKHYVTLNTNGLIFEGQLRTDVLNSGIDQLIFSIQTCDPNIYTALTKNPSYEKVYNIILETIQERNMNCIDCMIGVQFLDTPENSKYYETFLDVWKDHDVFTYKQVFHSWGDKFEVDNQGDDRYPCQYLWLYPNISHKGNVCSCYADFYDENIFGNLLDNSLEEIWQQSDLRHAMMSDHLTGEWQKHALCKDCNGWREFSNVFEWSKDTFRLIDDSSK